MSTAPITDSTTTDDAEGAAPPPEPAGVDIRRVISGSTADVPLAELSKKGFKQVKVLNQATIMRLIEAAVDQVISARAEKIGADERKKVIQESQSKFDSMAKEQLHRERIRIAELERANDSLLAETDELRRALGERDGEVQRLEEELARLREESGSTGGGTEKLMATLMERLQSAAPGAAVGQLEASLQKIADRLDRMPSGTGGAPGIADPEVSLEFLLRDEESSTESNITKVKVKEEKAGGVKSSLAKLRALQKGGKDGD